MNKSEQRLVAGAVGAVIFAMCFAGSFLAAFHNPSPHRLPVAVVAPTPLVHQLAAGLDAHAPGAFRIERYPDGGAARAAVAERAVDGALLASSQGLQLLVTGAGGVASAQTLTQAFSALAASAGQRLKVTDVAPLPAQNREGLSVFFLTLSVLFSSVLVGAVSSFAARAAPAARRVGVLVVSAVVIGAATAWIADGATGALPGHYLALAGIAALFSLAVSAPTAALARIAPPGVALAGLTFIVVGVPATGGPVGLAQFLPAFFRFFNPALPASVTIPAMTNVVYFDGHAIGQDLWVLTAWAVGGLLALLAASRFRVQRTPGVATSR